MEAKQSLYRQDTDIELINVLKPHLQNLQFFDVGAEKGGFSEALLELRFEQAFIFEPLPSHQKKLADKFSSAPVRIFPCALDAEDRQASFHVACDEDGKELDYFHSLNKIPAHGFFKHSKEITVDCRSLDSLVKGGEIPSNVGVLKIDTEGNDLKVLLGLGNLRPEVILCEYVPKEVYPEWEYSFPEKLVPYAKALGYDVVIAVQRRAGSESEIVRLNPDSFTPKDWGNLIFITKELFLRAGPDLVKWWSVRYGNFAGNLEIERVASVDYGAEVKNFLVPLLKSFQGFEGQNILLDVGALKGDFSKTLLAEGVVSKSILFEPNPDSYRELAAHLPAEKTTLVNAAVSSTSGTAEFSFGEDPATGSLYAPTDLTPPSTKKVEVKLIALDDYAASHELLTSISILKIDTQGADLQVLKGAVQLLAFGQPIVVAELIFAPLYENQDSAAEIIVWMEKHGYVFAGIFDDFYSKEGCLSWCDAVFIPKSRYPVPNSPFRLRTLPVSNGEIQKAPTIPERKRRSESLLRRVVRAIKNK
jgi:FkbM family methyltransferase